METQITPPEPYRYFENAREILSDKAGKDGNFYKDEKYVKMACNKAYSGLLIAMNELFKYKNIEFPKTKRKTNTSS